MDEIEDYVPVCKYFLLCNTFQLLTKYVFGCMTAHYQYLSMCYITQRRERCLM
jgi:hypothetical protein